MSPVPRFSGSPAVQRPKPVRSHPSRAVPTPDPHTRRITMRRIPVGTSKIRFISTASPRAGPSTRSCPMAAAAACPTSRTPTTRAARARPRDVPLPSLQPPADPQRSVRVFVVCSGGGATTSAARANPAVCREPGQPVAALVLVRRPRPGRPIASRRPAANRPPELPLTLRLQHPNTRARSRAPTPPI